MIGEKEVLQPTTEPTNRWVTGMMNVHEIAAASKRNESLHFGVADYSASTKSRTTNIGGPNKLYGVLTDKECAHRIFPSGGVVVENGKHY